MAYLNKLKYEFCFLKRSASLIQITTWFVVISNIKVNFPLYKYRHLYCIRLSAYCKMLVFAKFYCKCCVWFSHYEHPKCVSITSFIFNKVLWQKSCFASWHIPSALPGSCKETDKVTKPHQEVRYYSNNFRVFAICRSGKKEEGKYFRNVLINLVLLMAKCRNKL